MATDQMSREEVSALGSARREEVRRQIENSEKLKANPLLYLVSPQVKVSVRSPQRNVVCGDGRHEMLIPNQLASSLEECTYHMKCENV